jgi:Flp pilus assembly protein TadD
LDQHPAVRGPKSTADEIAGALAAGLAHHTAGRLAQADACYRNVLAADPVNISALHLLGLLAHQRGQPQAAVDLISRAISLNDRLPELHSNLGNALQAVGRTAEAEASYRRALALRPDNAPACNNLGVTLMEQGRPREAEAAFRQALALRPDYPDAHSNLGNALCIQGKPAEAEASCRRAVALRPHHVHALNNLGNALKDQGRLDEAQICYRRAIEVAPDFAEPHNNLGLALQDQGQLAEAECCYRAALRLRPNYADAYVNLGDVLLDRGDVAQALDVAECGLDAVETRELKSLFTRCLRRAGSPAMLARVPSRGHLLRALTEPWGRPGDVAAYVVAALKQDDALGELIGRANAAWPGRLSGPELRGSTG